MRNSTSLSEHIRVGLQAALFFSFPVVGWVIVFGLLSGVQARGAATLDVLDPTQPAPVLESFAVQTVIQSGFARTQVTQVFFHEGSQPVEVQFRCPLPSEGALVEVTANGEGISLSGEVVAKQKAENIHANEQAADRSSGIAVQEGVQAYAFRIGEVPPRTRLTLVYAYLEPVRIDAGVGRYHFALESGQTEDRPSRFWEKPAEAAHFSFETIIRQGWPLMDLRAPGFDDTGVFEALADGSVRFSWQGSRQPLNRDFVLYYRLADDLPGRVELVASRAESNRPGAFLLNIVPGGELPALSEGADYVFVVDASGSMAGKIGTVRNSILLALRQLAENDRFRIVAFNDVATELTPGWTAATEGNLRAAQGWIRRMTTSGGTNIFAGLDRALSQVDEGRATSLMLLTDAAANRGELRPEVFHARVAQADVRFFGFLIGNQANGPLMQVLADGSGGTYAQVANVDDIYGQLLLAQGKVTHASYRDFRISIDGVPVYDLTDNGQRSLYRGQPYMVFGRYAASGPATLRIDATVNGQPQTWMTTLNFPEVATDHPEIERLWAFQKMRELQLASILGQAQADETTKAIDDIALQYQIVTPGTAMLLLDDARFQAYGIERRAANRNAREAQAAQQRATQAPTTHQVDTTQPTFGGSSAPSVVGGGSLGPVHIILIAIGGTAAWFARRKRQA